VLDNIEQDVTCLGKKRQLVDVKACYYKNFLLPGQGSDCHSWFTQVKFNLTNTLMFLCLNNCVELFEYCFDCFWFFQINNALKETYHPFSQFEWEIDGINILVKSVYPEHVMH